MLPRLDEPTLYEWELNETHTRYDYPRAWPSEQTMHVQFSILATVNATVAVSSLILIISVLRSEKVRANVFNLYILFIVIPDFLASFFCTITCAMSAPTSAFYSEVMCGFQAFYLCWAITSNAWLNLIILFQIHKLLRRSNVRGRYHPPTKQQVWMHAAAVYMYAAFWGVLGAFNISWLPHKTHNYHGLVCFPMEYDRTSTFFFWLFFLPCFLGIPLVYAAYVFIDVWRSRLMPQAGRRRNISLFLLRLVCLYFIVWAPYLVVCLLGNFVVVDSWIFWAGAAVSHLQGLLTVLFSLTRDDVREAVQSFVTCRSAEGTALENQEATSMRRGIGKSTFSSNGVNMLSIRGSLWRKMRQSSAMNINIAPKITLAPYTSEHRASEDSDSVLEEAVGGVEWPSGEEDKDTWISIDKDNPNVGAGMRVEGPNYETGGLSEELGKEALDGVTLLDTEIAIEDTISADVAFSDEEATYQ